MSDEITIKLRFEGETREVPLEPRYLEQEDIAKAMRVAATRAFGVCMEDYQFEVGGALVADPEDFEPDETFDVVPRGDDIDVVGMVSGFVKTVVDFFSNAQRVVASQAFADEVMKIVHTLLRVAKGAAGVVLKTAFDSEFEALLVQANAVIERFTGQKDQIPVASVRDFLAKMQDQLK